LLGSEETVLQIPNVLPHLHDFLIAENEFEAFLVDCFNSIEILIDDELSSFDLLG
jgi:hypothetical protein